MTDKKRYRNLLSLPRKNSFIVTFLLIIFFVSLVAFYKIFLSAPTFVYAKVKMGQGQWWYTNTARPNIWLADSVRKGDQSKDLLGRLNAEIISVRRYPYFGNNQYDVYVTIKLRANENKNTGELIYNRSPLSIGQPIEIQFPKTYITGTVTDLSKRPLQDTYETKIIDLVYQLGYNKDFPYRYETIKVGDKYFDGEDYVFEILDKNLEKNIWSVVNNLNAQIYEREVTTTQNIVVKAKVKLKKKNNDLFFGEDFKVNTNALIPFSTSNFFFDGFIIRKIE